METGPTSTSGGGEQAAPSEGSNKGCPLCSGRGWKVEPDGGAGRAVRCDCQVNDRAQIYLKNAGIPERYRGCRLANFVTSHADAKVAQSLLRARKLSTVYVEHFYDPNANQFRESGLLFTGPPGVGKTHLATAVLSDLIRRYRLRGRFVDFTSLIHRIQSSFDPTSPESKHQILDPVVDAEILVIDELGAQKPSDWITDLLYLIMNTRYTRRLPTLFTSNYFLEDNPNGHRQALLSGRLSPLLVSRLYEMAQPIEFANWDYRREVKVHQHRIDR